MSLLVVGAAVSACSGSGGPAVASSGQEAYERATAEAARGRHTRAIELYRAALDYGRTSEIADDAQLGLARSYAADGQHLLAATEFTRFIEFYRDDPRHAEAAYERIQAYAALSPPYDLDQTNTEAAVAYIDQFLRAYPTSPNVAAANELRAELREKLARKAFETGRLYERRELYEAAGMAFARVLESYPSSAYADDALAAQLRAQVRYAEGSVPARQAERFRAALATYERFITLFPASPLLREAEAEYDRAYRGLQAVPPPPAATPAPPASASSGR